MCSPVFHYFMEYKYISVRPAKKQLVIEGQYTYPYGSGKSSSTQHSIRHALTMRATATATIWPGEYTEVDVPSEFPSADQCYAIEPHQSTSTMNSDKRHMWLIPEIVHSVSKKVRIPNLTSEPLTVKHHEHFCQIWTVMRVVILRTVNLIQNIVRPHKLHSHPRPLR
jgi:hypothetical protein